MKILKKGGSRENGGGGNEIHAPCACVNYSKFQSERSGYDKGRFWPNLRNCLYRYNIKHNH